MKKTLRVLVLAMATLMPFFASSQTHSLTVADGTATNEYVPVYGYYVDALQKTQYIYPAGMIDAAVEDYDMDGGSIISMTFYLSSPATSAWGCTFNVKVMEVPGTSLNGFANLSTLGTAVYTGVLNGTQSTMTINLTTPYTYQGGNILVEFTNANTGTYSHAFFYGVNTTYTSAWESSYLAGEGSPYNFIPKTTFTFAGGTQVSCPSAINLTTSEVLDTAVTLSWGTSPITGTTYSVYHGEDSTLIASGITGTSYTVTGLTPNSDYTFIVEANCSATESSLWRTISASTVCSLLPLPYSTNFDEMPANDNPLCWDVMGGGSFVHENTSQAYNGDQFLDLRGELHNFAVMPRFSESLNGKQVRFMTRPEGQYTACGNLQVGYITNVNDPTTFVPLATFSYAYWEYDMNYYEQIVEFNNVPEGARVAFCHNPVYDNYFWFVDSVVIENQPPCARPTNFQVTATTPTSVTFSWVDVMNTSVTYSILDFYDSTVYASGITGTSYTLTGLTPNTLYSFSLEANCSATESSFWQSIDVRTDCGVQSVPYFDNFEGQISGEHPICWEHLTHATGNVNLCYVYGYWVYEGQRALYFDYSQSTGNTLALPSFSTPTNQLRMRFMHRSESESSENGNMQVGYLTDSSDATTFVPLATLDRTTTYTQAIVNFDAAPANAIMAFRHVGTGAWLCWVVDNLNVELIPSCPDITGLNLVNLTTNSATVAWNGTDATAYQVEALLGSTVAGSATVTDTVATISGLTFGNDYHFRVRGICAAGDTSAWSDLLSVHIGYCVPAPVSRDGSGITNVTFGVDEVVNNNVHNQSAPFYDDHSNLVGSFPLDMPADVAITYQTGYTYVTLIWIDWNKNMMFEDDEIVYTGQSGNESPTTLTASFIIDPSHDTGYYRMRIAGSDGYFDDYYNYGSGPHDPCGSPSYAVYEDYTVHITEALPCMAVTDVTCSNITDGSVTLQWNHVGVATFTIMNGSTVLASGISGNSYTVTGLTPATYYTLSVVANCAAGDNGDPVSVSFATLCSGAQTLPFEADFSETSSTRSCWTLTSDNMQNSVSFVADSLGHYSMHFSSLNLASNSEYNQHAYSPVLDGTGLDAMKVRIRYRTETTTDLLYFGYTIGNQTVWNPAEHYTYGANDAAIYEAYLPATAERIAIRYYGDNRYNAFIDSVVVTSAVVNEVTLVNADATMGSVSPEGLTVVAAGESFTATATANDGYRFVAWMHGTTEVSTEPIYTFVPTADITLTATFALNINYYTVEVSYDENMGVVTGAGTFEEGTEVTLTARPFDGFEFVEWVEGENVYNENPYVFTLTGNRNITATFRYRDAIDDVEGSHVALYPNPASTSVTLTGLTAGSQVTLLDLNGRESGKWTVNSGKLTIDVSDKAKGAYFVRIVNANNTVVRKLIVK